jgi:hypothetical protein
MEDITRFLEMLLKLNIELEMIRVVPILETTSSFYLFNLYIHYT